MEILIKDMELPDSCFLCRFCRRQEYGEYVGEDTAWECVASKKRITDGQDLKTTFKHPDCPLVEVQYSQTEKKSLNGDVIDRQAAINVNGLDEEIRCEMCKNPIHTDRGCDGNCKYDEKLYEKIIQILNKRIMPLPSAQPEIIRCKDCKYNASSHKCLQPDSFFLLPADNFYCGYAKRRTDE